MITFWVMLTIRLAFWVTFLGSAWYIYTVGWERAGREVGWVWGVAEGFVRDFQAGGVGSAAGQGYGGKGGYGGSGNVWGRGGRGL
jgi:hypothetical protein